ncbi:precorrin-3B synthase [Melaminivora sp.]
MSNPSFAIKGRCPGALQPMASGDGLIVRVRPPLGRLSAAQALRVAELAQQYGSGVLELSTRANVQLRGVAPAQHPALLQALAAQGLLDTDARSESLRCIVLDPFWQPGDGLQAGALALQQAVLGAAGLDGLPAKFGWAVGLPGRPALAAVSADVRLWCADGQRWWLQPDGQAQTIACPDLDAALAAALALARWCAAQARARRAQGLHPGRMARLWSADAPQHIAPPPGCHWQASPVAPHTATEMLAPPPGAQPQGHWLLAAPLGRIPAADFARLAQALAAQGGDAGLRITPWRMVLAEGAPPADVGRWIADANDPRLRVWACSGAPGCDQALAPTLALAEELALHLPPGAQLHVAGCAKGCAHPGATTLALCAQAEAAPAGGDPLFALIDQGRADAPAQAHRAYHRASALLAQPALLQCRP